jgi:hypothetical protein
VDDDGIFVGVLVAVESGTKVAVGGIVVGVNVFVAVAGCRVAVLVLVAG